MCACKASLIAVARQLKGVYIYMPADHAALARHSGAAYGLLACGGTWRHGACQGAVRRCDTAPPLLQSLTATAQGQCKSVALYPYSLQGRGCLQAGSSFTLTEPVFGRPRAKTPLLACDPAPACRCRAMH